MLKPIHRSLLAIATLAGAGISTLEPAVAGSFSPMDMMNPGRFFGGDRGNRDYYDGPPPPPVGPYGAGPYGMPGYWGGAYGTGVPPYGVPGAGYGAPGTVYPGATPTAPAPAASPPSTTSGPSKADLEERIRQLEEQLRQQQAPSKSAPSGPPSSYQYYSGDQTPSNYPFRPLGLGK